MLLSYLGIVWEQLVARERCPIKSNYERVEFCALFIDDKYPFLLLNIIFQCANDLELLTYLFVVSRVPLLLHLMQKNFPSVNFVFVVY